MHLRHPDLEADLDETLALMQASDQAVFAESDWTEDELREEWGGIDLGRDAWLAIIDDRIAGCSFVYDVRGGRILIDGYVHPELVGRGVGTAILAAAEERALELGAGVPPEEELRIEAGHLVGDPGAPRLFAGRGYSRVRTFHRMVLDLDPDIAEPEWPAGFELRPLDVERDGPAVKATVDEAFADEWGYEPRDFDAWSERVFGVERFDPELFLLAWEGSELAAVSLNYPKRMGDWGWIGTLAVRPAWRRRGVGRALLLEGFRRFAASGERHVALGVDSENPSGATRLYESVGMRVLWRADVWRKVLRTGA